jgi:hypothetical protein
MSVPRAGLERVEGLDAPLEMPPANGVELAVLVHPLQAVLADGLEHPVAGLDASGREQQAVVGEAGQPVRHNPGLDRTEPGHRGGIVGGERRREDRGPAQQRLLAGRQQVIADGRAQRPVALVEP